MTENQISANYRYIENIQVSEKVVISAKTDQNLAVSKPDISASISALRQVVINSS